MTSVPKILLGEVARDTVIPSLEDGEAILFEKPLGVARPDHKAEAILLVLEPEESPWEVAERIRWALRVATQELEYAPRQNARLPAF